MNPGQIHNVTPMPRPGEQPLEPAELMDKSSEEITARDRNKSRIMSLSIAGMVHVFLFLLLAWMVISYFKDDEVELILESTGQNLDASLQKRAFAKKVTQDKPAPPSRMAAKTIISNKVSAVVMPEVPDFSDLPAFGADHGDGFGMGWYSDLLEPGVFRSTEPAWNDRNLASLASNIRSHLFIAHVRATTGTLRGGGVHF